MDGDLFARLFACAGLICGFWKDDGGLWDASLRFRGEVVDIAQIFIQFYGFDMVCIEEFAFVCMCIFMVYSAQAHGAQAYMADTLAAAAVGTDCIYVVDFALLAAHGTFGVLNAVVHIPSDIVRAVRERLFYGDVPPEAEVDEVIQEVMGECYGTVGQGEGILAAFHAKIPRKVIAQVLWIVAGPQGDVVDGGEDGTSLFGCDFSPVLQADFHGIHLLADEFAGDGLGNEEGKFSRIIGKNLGCDGHLADQSSLYVSNRLATRRKSMNSAAISANGLVFLCVYRSVYKSFPSDTR